MNTLYQVDVRPRLWCWEIHVPEVGASAEIASLDDAPTEARRVISKAIGLPEEAVVPALNVELPAQVVDNLLRARANLGNH